MGVNKAYYVGILVSEYYGARYVGITSDIMKRIWQHRKVRRTHRAGVLWIPACAGMTDVSGVSGFDWWVTKRVRDNYPRKTPKNHKFLCDIFAPLRLESFRNG